MFSTHTAKITSNTFALIWVLIPQKFNKFLSFLTCAQSTKVLGIWMIVKCTCTFRIAFNKDSTPVEILFADQGIADSSSV